MTRKDFQMIAAILRSTRSVEDDAIEAREQWVLTVSAFARDLENTNSQFDRGRFLAACWL